MRRRHVITLAGAALAASAGCSSLPPGDDRSSPRLGTVSVLNFDYDPHAVHVYVERDGEPVHWASYEATARTTGTVGGATVPCSWPERAGRYVVRARLDDRPDWRSVDLTTFESDLVAVSFSIGDAATGRGDDLGFTAFTTTNPNERCPDATPTPDRPGTSPT